MGYRSWFDGKVALLAAIVTIVSGAIVAYNSFGVPPWPSSASPGQPVEIGIYWVRNGQPVVLLGGKLTISQASSVDATTAITTRILARASGSIKFAAHDGGIRDVRELAVDYSPGTIVSVIDGSKIYNLVIGEKVGGEIRVTVYELR